MSVLASRFAVSSKALIRARTSTPPWPSRSLLGRVGFSLDFKAPCSSTIEKPCLVDNAANEVRVTLNVAANRKTPSTPPTRSAAASFNRSRSLKYLPHASGFMFNKSSLTTANNASAMRWTAFQPSRKIASNKAGSHDASTT